MILTGLAGGALGAGVTGGIGYSRLQKRQPAVASNAPIDIPYPQLEAEKQGEEIPTGSIRQLLGQGATSLMTHPMAVPALAATGIGSTLLGSHIANKHFHDKMKAEQQAELEAAQAEYDKAMFGMYSPKNIQPLKEKIGAALDSLCDVIEKKAGPLSMSDFMGPTPQPQIPVSMSDFMGKMPPRPIISDSSAAKWMGPVGMGMAGVGALGAAGGYRWAEGRKPENLLSKALLQRSMLRAQASPDPIQLQAVPEPAMETEGKEEKKKEKKE